MGSFSLMETQLGNVRWDREQVVDEGKREARPLVQLQGRPARHLHVVLEKGLSHTLANLSFIIPRSMGAMYPHFTNEETEAYGDYMTPTGSHS